jgi:uncharacterized membrane protein
MDHVRQQGRSFRIFAALIVPFLLTLNPQNALGQGFKMTQLEVPTDQANTTVPIAVNTSEGVVGYGTATSGATVGFLYSGGKYTVIKWSGSDNFTRALGINDSGEVVGDWLDPNGITFHGFTYVNGTYKQYDVGGNVSTTIFGINTAGDFVGSEGRVGTGGFLKGFTRIGGKLKEFYANGTDLTYAYAINSSDEVVGEYFDSSNVAHGYYRSAGGTITEIAYPGAVATSCNGINDSGEITGTYTNTAGLTYGFTYVKGKYASTDFAGTFGLNSKGAYVGYYWGVDGVLSGYLASPQAFKLATVKVPGNQQAQIWGVNNSGVSVGSYVDTTGTEHGLMISGGKVTNIDDPSGVSTICFAINSTNHIVGDYFDTSGNPHGFEYSAGKFTDIPGPSEALSSDASGINDAGEIAGDFFSSTDRTHHGFVLKAGEYKQLDPPGSTNTFGGGINTAGLVAFFWVDAKGYVQSSLYNGKKFTSIDVPGAASTYAQAVNTAGDIVFFVFDPYGVEHAALKKGNAYFIFDDPKGSQAAATGINDSNLIVGFYTPTGTKLAQPFKGTE